MTGHSRASERGQQAAHEEAVLRRRCTTAPSFLQQRLLHEPAATMGKSAGMPDEAAQGRGHGRAALDAPQRQPVPLQLRLVRRGEQSVAAFSLLLQSALYLRSAAGLTPLQHLHQAALLLLRASAFAAFTFMPHEAWLRWR